MRPLYLLELAKNLNCGTTKTVVELVFGSIVITRQQVGL